MYVFAGWLNMKNQHGLERTRDPTSKTNHIVGSISMRADTERNCTDSKTLSLACESGYLWHGKTHSNFEKSRL